MHGQFRAQVVPIPDYDVKTEIDSCQSQALITVNALDVIGAQMNLSWYLNGDLLADTISSTFVATQSGQYVIEVSYQFGGTDQPVICDTTLQIALPGNAVQYRLNVTAADCGINNGALEITVEGNSDAILTSLDGMALNKILEYDRLSEGQHLLTVKIGEYCTRDTVFIIPQNPCPVYIPNVFTPNNDGVNDVLHIGIPDQFIGHVRAFRIYDRWGTLIHSQADLPVGDIMWNGEANAIKQDPGVYIYVLEIEFDNGNIEILSGDVSIVR